MNKPVIYVRSIKIVRTVASIIGLVLIIFGAIYLRDSLGFNQKSFQKRMAKNPLRETLNRNSRLNTLSPAKQTSSFSPLIYDVTFEQNQNIVDLTSFFRQFYLGKKVIYVRFPSGKYIRKLQVLLHLNRSSTTALTIRDSNKRLVFRCQGQQCETALISPPPDAKLLQISFERNTPLQKSESLALNIIEAIPKDTPDAPSLYTLNLRLTSLEFVQLQTLTQSAYRLASSGKYSFPKNKLNGIANVIGQQTSESEIRIGLSGRTPEHYSFPPSMTVFVKRGPPIFGARRFKLYRIETRVGLYDFVTSSFLRDLGLIAPDQKLVRLSINNQIQGVFLFEDLYSTPFFENIGQNESFIYGFDSKVFFEDYPNAIRLKTDTLYSPNISQHPVNLNTAPLESAAFVKKIEHQELSTLLAVTSLFQGTHGLGADDLRFYQNPLTGKFHPITRDLKVSRGSIKQMGETFSFATHFSYMYQKRPISVFPGTLLSNNVGERRQVLMLWDIHPTIMYFLRDFQHRALFEKVLLELVESDIITQFESRVKNAYSQIQKVSGIEKELSYFAKQVSAFEDRASTPYFGNHIKYFLDTATPFWKQISSSKIRIFNRLPFSIYLKASIFSQNNITFHCPLLQGKNGTHIIGPLWNSLTLTSPDASSLIYRIFSQGVYNNLDTELLPFCDIEFDNKHLEANPGKLVDIFLPNDERLQAIEVTSMLKWPSLLPPLEKPSTPQRHALFYLFDIVEDRDTITFRYVLHRSYNQQQQVDIDKIILRDASKKKLSPVRPIKKIRFSDIRHLPESSYYCNDFTKNFPYLFIDPYRFFAKNSLIVEFTLKKADEPIYFHLDTTSVHEALGIPTHQNTLRTYFYDARENIIPPKDDSAPYKSIRKRPEWIEVEKVTNEITYLKVRKNRHVTLQEELVIAPRESLTIEPGVKINVSEQGKIRVEGGLRILGTVENKVEFIPLDDIWGGIAIVDSWRKNIIRYAVLQRAKEYTSGDFATYGGISILRSRLTLEHVQLLDFQSLDAINVYYGELTLVHSTILNALDDAIDSDFSRGRIDRNFIHGAGGDGVDMNQSYFEITNNSIMSNADKGISCGEKSVLSIMNNHIENNQWGLAVKDASLAYIQENVFQKNQVGIAKLIKKPWYTPPILEVVENSFKENATEFKDFGFSPY